MTTSKRQGTPAWRAAERHPRWAAFLCASALIACGSDATPPPSSPPANDAGHPAQADATVVADAGTGTSPGTDDVRTTAPDASPVQPEAAADPGNTATEASTESSATLPRLDATVGAADASRGGPDGSLGADAGDIGRDGGAAFDRAAVKELMLRAARYQLTLYNDTALNDWIDSTFYAGLMATYRTTSEPDLLAAAKSWGQRRNWDVYLGTSNPRFADNQTCTQTYLELYELDPSPANEVMIARARTVFDSMVAAPRAGRVEWNWCDALFMAPPGLARMGTILQQPKYIDLMHTMFVDVKAYLFSPTNNLFFRDARFFNGDTFWSRGNGWVIAGSARILDYLPATDSRRTFYDDLITAMAGALAKVQGADGLWRTNLLHPEATGLTGPETSGTGFFTYGMAWGINHGVLPRDVYLPIVTKAWSGLVRNVSAQGRLGYVQNVGDAPVAAGATETHPFGVGALLLAGSEVVKL